MNDILFKRWEYRFVKEKIKNDLKVSEIIQIKEALGIHSSIFDTTKDEYTNKLYLVYYDMNDNIVYWEKWCSQIGIDSLLELDNMLNKIKKASKKNLMEIIDKKMVELDEILPKEWGK